jgi:hypothetical protein
MCCDARIASFKVRIESLSSSKLSLTALVLGMYWWDVESERACLVVYMVHRDWISSRAELCQLARSKSAASQL